MTFIRLPDGRLLNLAQVQRAEFTEGETIEGEDHPPLLCLTLFAFESGRADIEQFEGEDAVRIWKRVEEQLS